MHIQLIHHALALYTRSNNDNDDNCSGKNKHSAQCQKPENDNGLTVGLAVGLPVAAVLLMVSYFIIRNYRKNKKESMEHDPDFDENGEATVLPDFPIGAYGRPVEMEDPFDNRNSARFPPPAPKGANFHGGRSSSASFSGSTKGDAYVQSFVLPYQHQIGSKVSLDEYAKQLGEYGSVYAASPRGSAYLVPGGHTRAGSSNLSNFPVVQANGSGNKSTTVSPQKSSLKHETKPSVPEAAKSDLQYGSIAPEDGIEEVSDDSDSSIRGAGSPQFAINYENESDPHINNTLNQKLPSPVVRVDATHDTSNDSFNTTTDQFIPKEVPTINDTHPERIENNHSPFSDNAQVDTPPSVEPTVTEVEDEQIDGDFDFSNESADASAINTVGVGEQLTANTSASNLDVPGDAEGQKLADSERVDSGSRKSPRISAFNLLKNVSDDEDDGQEEHDEDKPLENDLSPDQEEELRRMKSVYRLYFDRANSVKRKDSVKSEHPEYEANYEFQADPDQPLPQVDMDQYLKINTKLRTDTDYNKRLTTTSSIYTDNGPEFVQRAPPQQQYNYYLQDQSFQQFYQEHVQSLPPLQSLPNPSDIRKSTIQTYTDYQPKSKNNPVTSPTMKQPFNPIESDNVWTSPASSPVTNNPPTFETDTYTKSLASAPSATQLSRSSVVMLNPVTEITKQRKFKPAGSLPSGHRNNHAYANAGYAQQGYPQQGYPQPGYPQQQPMHQQHSGQFTHEHSTDSLIPGGKKSDVRKMMNSNF
ncbi:hypothetical protein PSN45_001472 [Yamadazyma tenuis]|uniref:Uncharacterized protein n=1 Tax=Candida tenuis (strain ATCC 10573 / BCRC 21748 / CBS 615 / JCM 9827 / NBRC 10315 / NRRL Y-1498 / VKM Y-70) TaxID=590646 RepID=G3BFV0_CANTC|nr:uncharacterized protein CANTEDRAFT_132427 [Yamadazyma tenuis ATCC 10573]EGV60736.1 hypothetical protein CANTEDRAFT_132427 [Yamadazyma tenuis ATCC 10573]WEJ93995.1 hypothetical protein PSN45_001472 [Yamadazyma tenuis]